MVSRIGTKPRRLSIGEVIGIVAPSSPFKDPELDAGIAVLQTMGFKICLAEGLRNKEGYLAGPDEARVRQLHLMFRDDGVQAVMCARGGFGALRIIPMLDYDLVLKAGKPFIGFSDGTALHQAIYRKAGLVTFHGPTVCSLGKSDHLSRQSFFQALTSGQALSVSTGTVRVIRPGKAVGIVAGGNLATLCHLLGTPYFPDLAGSLLVLEDTNEAGYRIDRMLTQMKLAGCFRNLAGVLLGDFTDCADQQIIDHIAERIFGDLGIPVMGGLPVGHGRRNLTFALGLPAELDTSLGGLHYAQVPTQDGIGRYLQP